MTDPERIGISQTVLRKEAVHPHWAAMLASVTNVSANFTERTVILCLPTAEAAHEMGFAIAALVRECRKEAGR